MKTDVINYLDKILVEKDNKGESNIKVTTGATSIKNASVIHSPVIVAKAHPHVLKERPLHAFELSKVKTVKTSFPVYVPPKKIEPVEILGDPIPINQYLFYPDQSNQLLYYIQAQPYIIDFDIAIHKQETGGTLRIIGAKATISVSIYSSNDLSQIQTIITESPQLAQYSQWKSIRLNIRELGAELLLDRGLVNLIDTSTSSDNGTATFLIDLTELGAQDFLDAIQGGRPDTLRGSCNISGKIYIKRENTPQIKPISLQVNLGNLLKNVTMTDVRIINTQTSLQSTFVVSANPLIENITLSLKTNDVTAQEFVFDETGGRAQMLITDLNFNDLNIDLITLVNYKDPAWPIIESKKTLSFSENSWSDLIDPITWLRRYRIMAYLYDKNNQILREGSLSDKVAIEFVYKANYLQNATHEIRTIKDVTTESIDEISIPLPDHESPGTIQLRVFAERKNDTGTVVNFKNRDIDFNSSMIIVKVLADASIEIVTNIDPATESGKKEEGFLLLESLTRRRLENKINFNSSQLQQISEEERDELFDDEVGALSVRLESDLPAMAVPSFDPVPFAPIPNKNLYWPVESSHPSGKSISYQAEDGRFIGNRSRRFMADRSQGTRYHSGVDIYGLPGDSIVAIDDGIIINFYHFYSDTYALIVQHSEMTVNYGEVDRNSLKSNGLMIGDRVFAGEVIGTVGRLRSGNSMCHFETYTIGTRTNKRWMQSGRRPSELLNPTALLLHLKRFGLSRVF